MRFRSISWSRSSISICSKSWWKQIEMQRIRDLDRHERYENWWNKLTKEPGTDLRLFPVFACNEKTTPVETICKKLPYRSPVHVLVIQDISFKDTFCSSTIGVLSYMQAGRIKSWVSWIMQDFFSGPAPMGNAWWQQILLKIRLFLTELDYINYFCSGASICLLVEVWRWRLPASEPRIWSNSY